MIGHESGHGAALYAADGKAFGAGGLGQLG